MRTVLTGSVECRKTTYKKLVEKDHTVTVISSSNERKKDIEASGAKAAIGSMPDADFLAETFKGADIVYLMETMDAAGGDTVYKHKPTLGEVNLKDFASAYNKQIRQ